MKLPKRLPRNGAARAARLRNSSGPMKHKLEPRKGAKNDQGELLEEYGYHCDKCNTADYPLQRFCDCNCEACNKANGQ